MNMQGWNRYSYVGNDPLAFTDPNGFSWLSNVFNSIGNFFSGIAKSVVNFLKTNFLSIVQITATAVLSIVMPLPVASAIGAAITAGISGGNLGQVLKASAIAAVTAFAFQSIGPAPSFASIAANPGAYAAYVGESAVVGCVSAAASGGSCKSGALSGAIGSALSPFTNEMFPNAKVDVGQRMGATLTQATIGGLASVAGGGKFANGAITGAYQYLATVSLESAREQSARATLEAGRSDPMDAMNMDICRGARYPDPVCGSGSTLEGGGGGANRGGEPLSLSDLLKGIRSAFTGPVSKWDSTGGMKGVNTNLTAAEFGANLEANGYTATTTMGTNGPVTIYQNGSNTYTIYTRTSPIGDPPALPGWQ